VPPGEFDRRAKPSLTFADLSATSPFPGHHRACGSRLVESASPPSILMRTWNIGLWDAEQIYSGGVVSQFERGFFSSQLFIIE
jgi:hypothetical protein